MEPRPHAAVVLLCTLSVLNSATAEADVNYDSPDALGRSVGKAVGEALAEANAWTFDPLTNWWQFGELVALILLITGLIHKWRAVLMCITGDNTLRIDRWWLIFWGFCQCCGMCYGDWTRWISWCVCCLPFNRCQRLRGRNLKRAAGQWMGVVPVALRMQNIVLGGLPRDRTSWFATKPDIFVQIEPDELQPILNTEIISDADPDLVQFSTSLTLLVKDNVAENSVHITVKRMHLTGPETLADCYIAPAQLLTWAKAKGTDANKGQNVRIALGGPSRKKDPLCLPWLFMHLSVPVECQYLTTESEEIAPVLFNSRPEIATTLEQQSMSLHSTDGLHLETTFKRLDIASLRDAYPLTDSNGKFTEEMPIRNNQWQIKKRAANCFWFLLMLSAALWVFRIWTEVCLEEYRQLEIAHDYYHTRLREKATIKKDDIAIMLRSCNLWAHDITKFTQTTGINEQVDTLLWKAAGVKKENITEAQADMGTVCHHSKAELNRSRCWHLSTTKMFGDHNTSHIPRVFRILQCHERACGQQNLFKGSAKYSALGVAIGFALLVLVRWILYCRLRAEMKENLETQEDHDNNVRQVAPRSPSYTPIEDYDAENDYRHNLQDLPAGNTKASRFPWGGGGARLFSFG